MKDKIPLHERPCEAMEKKGITNPNSQEGIDFCTDCCPYDKCIVMESDNRKFDKIVRLSKKERAIDMRKRGCTIRYISKQLGISICTTYKYLRDDR